MSVKDHIISKHKKTNNFYRTLKKAVLKKFWQAFQRKRMKNNKRIKVLQKVIREFMMALLRKNLNKSAEDIKKQLINIIEFIKKRTFFVVILRVFSFEDLIYIDKIFRVALIYIDVFGDWVISLKYFAFWSTVCSFASTEEMKNYGFL